MQTFPCKRKLGKLSLSLLLALCVVLVDEAGKMVSGEEEGSEVVAADDKGDGQEVIKVYIFKADDTGEEMGE